MKKNSILFMLTTLVLMPILVLLYWSVTNRVPWPTLWSGNIDFSTWDSLFRQKPLLMGLMTSVVISCATVIFVNLLVLPVCISILVYKIKLPRLFWIILFIPVILPNISLSIGLHHFFLTLGAINSMGAVVLAHSIFALPYSFRMMYSTCMLLGHGYGEQASILGANFKQIILYIYLPNLRLSMILSSLLVFIVSYSQYLITFFIGGGLVKTLPILLFPVIQSGNRSEISAYSLFFVLTCGFIMFLLEKVISKRFRTRTDLWML